MKLNFRMGVGAGYLTLAAAIVAGVTVATFIDVQISLVRIDSNDSSTWPNMAPEIRYFLIPVFALPLIAVAVLVNLLLQRFGQRRFPRVTQWVLLGLAFSLAHLFFPLIRLGVSPFAAVVLATATALSAVVLVRWRYAVPYGRDTE